MTRLDDPMNSAARALVDSARGAQATVGEQDAVWSQIQGRIAAGDPGPDLERAGQTGGLALKPFLIAFGTAGAVAVALALLTGGPEATPSPVVGSPAAESAERRATVAMPVDAGRRQSTPEPAPVSMPAAKPEPPAAASPPAAPKAVEASVSKRDKPRVEPKRRGEPKRESAPPPASASSLAQETRLLTRAQSALAGGRHDEAISLADEHRRTFPKGTLRAELSAVRVLALCKSGNATRGRKAATQFLRTWPKSALAPSVRSACD